MDVVECLSFRPNPPLFTWTGVTKALLADSLLAPREIGEIVEKEHERVLNAV